MTVTLGADGWTNITESSDTHKIYVSSSTGNDATAVIGDIDHPYQSLSAAIAQARDGFPDWVLLKAGDTWVDQSFGNLSVSGRSADEPLLLSSYGSGSRPLIETPTNVVGIGTNNGVAPNAANNIAVVGLEFYAYTRDPNNPYFAGSADNGGVGIDNLNHFHSFLIEDSKFSFYNAALVFDSPLGVQSGNLTLNRNIVVDSYMGTHSTGFLAGNISHIVMTENLFDHNGWNENNATGSTRTVFSHNIYLQDTNGPVTAIGNIITNSPDNGLKARNGGNISDNLFAGNGSQLLVYQLGEDGAVYGFNQSPSLVTNNVFLAAQDISASDPGGGGVDIAVNAPGAGPVQVTGNIFAHSNSANGNAIGLSEYAVNDTVTNNVIYDWNFGILNMGSGNNISNNQIDVNADNAEGYNFPDPNRSIGSYNASIGGAATLDAFLAEARLQSKDHWNPLYTADAVNDYIREGFGTSDGGPPVTAPPPSSGGIVTPPPSDGSSAPPPSDGSSAPPPSDGSSAPPPSDEPVPNHSPVVTVPNPTVQAAAGETLQVSELFSATDADNDTLTFLFNDTTPGGGHFAVNGVEQAANQVFSVTPAELAQTTFVPAVGGSDDLVMGASDGHAFSGWSNLHIEGAANQTPVVTVPNPTVQAAAGEFLHLSDLFSVGGGSASGYILYDTTPGGGHFVVSGNLVNNPADTAVLVTPALFAQTTFIPGIDGSDHLLLGAFNAYGFSGWAEVNII